MSPIGQALRKVHFKAGGTHGSLHRPSVFPGHGMQGPSLVMKRDKAH